jgi:hypothetical protein
MRQLEITEEMVNELRTKVLDRLKDDFINVLFHLHPPSLHSNQQAF